MPTTNMNITKARVYNGPSLYQVNISRDLGRLLAQHNWNNGTKVYMIYNPDKDEIVITRDVRKVARLIGNGSVDIGNGNAEGVICTSHALFDVDGPPGPEVPC